MREVHESATNAAISPDTAETPTQPATTQAAAKAGAKSPATKASGAKATVKTDATRSGDASATLATTPQTAPSQPTAADTPPTLRALLAALYANAALATPATPTRATSASTQTTLTYALPTDDEMAATYAAAIGAPLSPAKRAMLTASLRDFDAPAAARRLTVEQLAQITRGVNPSTVRSAQAENADEEADGLTVARLDAMTDETWRAFVHWLLEREGYTVERLTSSAASPVWRGARRGLGEADGDDGDADGAVSTVAIASAVHLPAGWPLEDEAVRRAASTALSEAGAQAILITTAPATVGALLEARRLGVRLWDRAALGERLRGLATAYQREQAQAQRQTQARAAATTEARDRLLAALAAVEVAFVGSGALAAKRVSGRAAVKRAATEAREAQRLASQALLAWETLIGEWQASFGERPARDGSLALLADPDALDGLATRGEHLRDALLTAIQRLVTTPAEGELGYGAWRQALSEDLLARIQTLRWRTQALDPDRWHDFAAAHDEDALLEATAATNAAAHAAARAQQAYAQLAERVGLG